MLAINQRGNKLNSLKCLPGKLYKELYFFLSSLQALFFFTLELFKTEKNFVKKPFQGNYVYIGRFWVTSNP
jgi:hypothetical protein